MNLRKSLEARVGIDLFSPQLQAKYARLYWLFKRIRQYPVTIGKYPFGVRFGVRARISLALTVRALLAIFDVGKTDF
jgi:hypothetical protein